MKYSLNDLNKIYDLNLKKIVKEINAKKAKIVLLQFPDGFKPYSKSITDFLEKQTKKKVQFIIWLGTCYGACDTPLLGKLEKEIDLTIQFGHNKLMPCY